MKPDKRAFTRFAWIVLGYNFLVILWGAYVRASGSGAGCGNHWPFCNGEIVPRPQQVETIIEFTHRLSSGLTLVLVAALAIWAWRSFPRGRKIRWSAGAALLFTITEALVGAALVLLQLTGTDTSVSRAVSIVVHLVNTFLLLASLAITAWLSTYPEPERLVWGEKKALLVFVAVAGLVLVGASGAITALGDTLFPSVSLAEGLRQDTDAAAHFLIRLRVYHPFIAISLGVYGWFLLQWIKRQQITPLTQRLVNGVTILFGVQLVLGGFNVVLLAPIWLQLVHLLVSDLVWSGLVLIHWQLMGEAAVELPLRAGNQLVHHEVL
jgi:heme A synthase